MKLDVLLLPKVKMALLLLPNVNLDVLLLPKVKMALLVLPKVKLDTSCCCPI